MEDWELEQQAWSGLEPEDSSEDTFADIKNDFASLRFIHFYSVPKVRLYYILSL